MAQVKSRNQDVVNIIMHYYIYIKRLNYYRPRVRKIKPHTRRFIQKGEPHKSNYNNIIKRIYCMGVKQISMERNNNGLLKCAACCGKHTGVLTRFSNGRFSAEKLA